MAIALLGASAGPASAAIDRQSKVQAVRVNAPLPLDASLADPLWQPGLMPGDFFNFTRQRPAAMKTQAYLLYDDTNIYVAFHCEQAGTPIIATQTTNNVGEGLDDYVGIGIDPSVNGSRVYQFLTTPKGVQYATSSESSRYNPTWKTAAKVDGTSWNAVMIIPLKDLRASPGSWRINLIRHLSSSDEDLTWAYETQMDAVGDSTYWPQWTGLVFKASSARPKPYANLYGLASAGLDRNVFPQLNGTVGPSHAPHLGVDGAIPFTDTLAFVGTLNPDYSNVESDQQTITPQQFQRALVEYRPFFAQGQNYLTPNANFGINGPSNQPFYTPSIGQFNGGAKVEGTTGLNAIGALAAIGPGFNDEAYGFNHRTADQASRYWFNGVEAHHTNDGSSVTPCPFVGTTQLSTCTDSLFEFGTRISSLKTGVEEAFDYATETGQYVPDTSKGHSFLGFVNVNRAHYSLGAAYRDIQPYYAPVDGFTLINDMRGLAAFGNAQGQGSEHSPFKSYSAGFGAERYFDDSGNVRYSEYSWFVQFQLHDLLSFNTGPLDSQIRQYVIGYPVYLGGQDFSSHTNFFGLNYRDGTPQSLDVGWSYGPNAGFLAPGGIQENFYSSFYFNEIDVNGSDQLAPKWNLTAGYSGDSSRCFFGGCFVQQSLRRVSVGYSLGPDSNISVAYRTISGTGYSPTAVNLAAEYHRKFNNGNEMYLEWGTPQTTAQLYRFVAKYVLHVGGSTGT
ncbi:MAG: hypothetical protein JO293_09115 [Candidatus Eremiobacteraeota bacterium]|nr:hypothetical protein [Candidatus Eremiobacteraeota bacterium]